MFQTVLHSNLLPFLVVKSKHLLLVIPRRFLPLIYYYLNQPSCSLKLNASSSSLFSPKLKVHQQMHFTAACKNLYGCVAGKKKILLHNLCKNEPVKFAEMILANARKAQAILHIADGIEAMHIKGPRGGESHPFGKIIISDNPLQLDYVFATMANYKLKDTPLFAALPDEIFRDIEKSCEEALSSPDFSHAENFIHSYINDISFSPPKLIRSGFRSMKFKLLGKI